MIPPAVGESNERARYASVRGVSEERESPNE
jgi:hypothetical protein